jgi:hypothetical protein
MKGISNQGGWPILSAFFAEGWDKSGWPILSAFFAEGWGDRSIIPFVSFAMSPLLANMMEEIMSSFPLCCKRF